MALSPQRVRQVYLWHKWSGLISGLFIFFVSLTGTIAVFKNEIDAWLTPGRSVAPQAKRAPLEDMLASMQKAYPKSRVGAISVADPRLAWDVHKVSISDTVQEGGKSKKVSREVFINPHDAQVTGSRTGENLANIIRQTHLRFFYFGWQGRVAVGVVGLTLLITTLTGWMIYGPFMKKLVWGRVRWKQRLQLAVSDWHKMAGFAALLFNTVISLTGATLGLENLARFSEPAKQVLHPAPSAAAKKMRPASVADRLTVDEAVAKAREALPGFEPTRISLPRAKRAHWMMNGNIQGHFANDGASWVMLDTQSGVPLAKHDARAALPATRAYNLSEPLHFGDFAGPLLKVLYLLLGLFSCTLSLTGYWLWILKSKFFRSRSKRSPKPQKAPAVSP